MDMINFIIDHLLKHKLFHLFWLLAVTIFFTASITGIKINDKHILKGLKVDNSMEVWYSSNDPNLQNYYRFQDIFGTDEFIVIAFEHDHIFSTKTLKKISDLTQKLESFPYVNQALSLTSVENVVGEDDSIVFSKLIPEITDDEQELKNIKSIALRNPMYRNNIISGDGKVTAIILNIIKPPKGNNYQRHLTDLIYDFIDEESENNSYKFHVAGLTILIGLEDKASTDDTSIEYLLTTILVTFILYFIHRRMIFVFISFSVIIIANICIHGLMPLLGSTFNIVTAILSTLIMVIGVADTIHFISEFKEQSLKTPDTDKATKRAFKMIVLPCFFTSITTAAGFASMMISDIKVIKEFAAYAAIGMLITFIVNMTLVSIWLGFLKPAPEKKHFANENKRIHSFLKWVAGINRKHVKLNIVIALLVFIISITGILRIQVNTHEIEYFKKSHPMRIATEFIEDRLTGTMAFEIMLTGKKDAFKDPEALKKIDELQSYVHSMENTHATFSVTNYIKEMHKVIQNGEDTYYTIPSDPSLLNDLLFLGEGSETLDSYIDTMDYSAARIHSRLNFIDNNTLKAINAKIVTKMNEIFDTGEITPEISGLIPLYVNMTDYLIDSQKKGFGIALVAICIMLSILVKSFKLGLISMVPNIIPIFLTFGIMGWLGIYLDIGTILIASVSIGLAVDDTIHFISRFRYNFDKYGQYEKALDETIYTIGAPLTITSIVLFAGFLVLMISTFKPIVYFGLLTSITMMSALIGDLFILPALIKIFKPFGTEKEMIPIEEAGNLSFEGTL